MARSGGVRVGCSASLEWGSRMDFKAHDRTLRVVMYRFRRYALITLSFVRVVGGIALRFGPGVKIPRCRYPTSRCGGSRPGFGRMLFDGDDFVARWRRVCAARS